MARRRRIVISDSMLAILAAVALIFAGAAFLEFSEITGYATSPADVTLTVSGSVSCSATDNAIDFGTLGVEDMNYSTHADSGDYHTVENTGNENLTVNGSVTEEMFDTVSAPDTSWEYYCHATTESGTCSLTAYDYIPDVATDLTTGELVYNLTPAAVEDELIIAHNVTIPADELADAKSGTVTYVCLQTAGT